MAATRDKLLTVPLQRGKRLRVGPLEIGVSMDAEHAERLRNSVAYRRLIRPALSRFRRAPKNANGHKNTGVTASNGAVPTGAPTPEAREIIERIAELDWYHSIDLPHGVTTPGFVDHRQQLPLYGLPEDMTGMRVLDVATFDGFWAFEFERRGADVVAIDIESLRDTDIPRNWTDEFEASKANRQKPLEFGFAKGFELAKDIIGSKVQKEFCSVYDVSPERLGMFDMVFCSDLLIHLRDPLHAMEAIWTVTKDFAVFGDVYHPDLDTFGQNALVEFTYAGKSDVWWRPSVACYELWLKLARFERVDEISRFVLESNFQSEIPKVVFHAYR
jgi:tRNA (mo5U34)-methyltransferase